MIPDQLLESVNLGWGFGPTIKPGDSVYLGRDKEPRPHEVRQIRLEAGRGAVVVIGDNYERSNMLHMANSVEMWKEERLKYLIWNSESDRRALKKVDDEIASLQAEIASRSDCPSE